MGEGGALNQGRQGILPILIGVVFFLGITLIFSNSDEQVSLQDLALGPATKAEFPSYNGKAIHCLDIEGDEAMHAPPAMRCVEAWKGDGEKPVFLMLGNSQAHAINQLKSGDVPFSYLLHSRLESMGYDAIMFSQPNASLQEHYVLFAWLLDKLAVKALILPAVFDDTRENGIRAGLASAFEDTFVQKELSRTEVGKEILAATQSLEPEEDLAGLKGTPQRIVESTINNWLDENWLLWKSRPEMRGKLLTEIFFLRNWVFGIDAQSKRKIIPGRYTKNLAALKAILKSCVERKIQTILYVAPLRNDVESPYVNSEYEQFKQDVADVALANGAIYTNLETLVPGDLWGLKDSTNLSGEEELDFMHFQGGGHRLLADALFDLLEQNHFFKTVP